jgi:hypothetical protein
MTRLGIFSSFFLLIALTAGSQEDLDSCSTKTWLKHPQEVVTLLETAEIVSVEEIGMGVTKPWRVDLRNGSERFSAVHKPIKRGRTKGFWESYEAEVAAYVMDRLLGLDMVPPTMVRRVKSNLGSLQLWVDDCHLYAEVEDNTPRSVEWSWQLSRMKMFDVLIHNTDRNAQNFLVDQDFHIILIDHSRAFTTDKGMLKKKDKLPVAFDRKLVEKLKSLTREDLDEKLGDLLLGRQIKAILERRDGLIEHLNKLIAEKGKGLVLF